MAIRAVASGDMPGGEQWSNTLHFAGVLSGEEEALAISQAIVGFYGDLTDQLVNDWALTSVSIGQEGFGASFEYDVDVSGTGSSVPLPNDCAVVVELRTALPTRSGRGRIFLGGFAASLLTRLDGTGAAVLNEGLATAIGDSVDSNLMNGSNIPDFVVYSRKLDEENTVTGGSVARRLATQRRRDMDTPRAGVLFG